MSSTRLTKVNIDTEQYELVKVLAAAKGISATKMLEYIILAYITNQLVNSMDKA